MLITQSAGKFLKRKNSINLDGKLIDLENLLMKRCCFRGLKKW